VGFLGFRVKGFGVCGSGFRCCGIRFRVTGQGSRVQGLGICFMTWGSASRFRDSGFGSTVHDSRFRVWGLGSIKVCSVVK
jgi:hypothetical protein